MEYRTTALSFPLSILTLHPDNTPPLHRRPNPQDDLAAILHDSYTRRCHCQGADVCLVGPAALLHSRSQSAGESRCKMTETTRLGRESEMEGLDPVGDGAGCRCR